MSGETGQTATDLRFFLRILGQALADARARQNGSNRLALFSLVEAPSVVDVKAGKKSLQALAFPAALALLTASACTAMGHLRPARAASLVKPLLARDGPPALCGLA